MARCLGAERQLGRSRTVYIHRSNDAETTDRYITILGRGSHVVTHRRYSTTPRIRGG